MKKLFSLLLACMMLFLTACNQTPPNETTTGNSQNQEQSKDSELKDTIIYNGVQEIIDIPSRIIFQNNNPYYTFYYSKADGKAYVYCFDPLCDHAGGKCFANPEEFYRIPAFELKNTFFINGRFYTASQYGQIYSFSFDGSDLKIEYGEDYFPIEDRYEKQFRWSPNFCAYDKYIYIPMNADENGNSHTLRFNTETKEMEDLTEKTGNDFLIYFFYNEEIYGLDTKLRTWIKADLELKEITPIEAQPTNNQFYGSTFFDTKFERIDSKTKKYLGLESYDMKTGETKLFTNEMLGLDEKYKYNVLHVDENYVYFKEYSDIKILVGTKTNPKGELINVYKTDTGKLYRMKHDGTECILMYDNPNFEFKSNEAVVYEDKIILNGNEFSVNADGSAVSNIGMMVGTIGSDGKIDKFEPIELVY